MGVHGNSMDTSRDLKLKCDAHLWSLRERAGQSFKQELAGAFAQLVLLLYGASLQQALHIILHTGHDGQQA